MSLRAPTVGREHKIFDPADASTPAYGSELLDPSVVLRDGQWMMFTAGQAHCFGPPDIFVASLPPGASLSPSGWTVARDASGELLPIAGRGFSADWDAVGGRHCPSYVRGYDARRGRWVERLYYAGAAENIGGPYSIGYLEWEGERWFDQPTCAFRAEERWERGSVYEPNVIYHDGLWKLWYVAGSNRDNYLVHGYAESADGVTNWRRSIFAEPEMRMFDFCVRPRGKYFVAIFTRVWLGPDPPTEAGLWWCAAALPSGRLDEWSKPIHMMDASDRGWHRGPFKPSLAFDESSSEGLVFFAGNYNNGQAGPFPFAFTTGAIELTFP